MDLAASVLASDSLDSLVVAYTVVQASVRHNLAEEIPEEDMAFQVQDNQPGILASVAVGNLVEDNLEEEIVREFAEAFELELVVASKQVHHQDLATNLHPNQCQDREQDLEAYLNYRRHRQDLAGSLYLAVAMELYCHLCSDCSFLAKYFAKKKKKKKKMMMMTSQQILDLAANRLDWEDSTLEVSTDRGFWLVTYLLVRT